MVLLINSTELVFVGQVTQNDVVSIVVYYQYIITHIKSMSFSFVSVFGCEFCFHLQHLNFRVSVTSVKPVNC